jgi:hypothetical protein
MKNQKYHFQIDEIEISTGIIEKFMGYQPDQSPEPLPQMIGEVMKMARQRCDIRGGYVVYDHVDIHTNPKALLISDVHLNVKKIVARQLQNIEGAAIFVCTAGKNISDYSKELMRQGEFMKGYIADVAGSEIVEAAMDKIQDELELRMNGEGLFITDRYSPGYCGWKVDEQSKLFSLLPEGFCDITLTPSSLMKPIKSVSGIIGIGQLVRRKGYVCQHCDMVNCIYREKKVEKQPGRC